MSGVAVLQDEQIVFIVVFCKSTIVDDSVQWQGEYGKLLKVCSKYKLRDGLPMKEWAMNTNLLT